MNYSRGFVIFWLFFVLVFLGLGTWQLYRKTEKEALLEALNQSETRKAHNVDEIKSPLLFELLYAEGSFIPGKTIFLQAKTFHGKSGVYVLDVFRTKKGKFILIQRGWAAQKLTAPLLEPLRIEGIARVPSPPGYFQPANIAPTYFWLDLKSLSSDLAIHLLPYYLVAKKSYDARIHPTDPIPRPTNNHLQYAITWYALALALLNMLWWGRKDSLRKESS